jgi:hypothetical protein
MTGRGWESESVGHVAHQIARREHDVCLNAQVMKQTVRTELHCLRNGQIEFFCAKKVHYVFSIYLSCKVKTESDTCTKIRLELLAFTPVVDQFLERKNKGEAQ